MKIAFVIHHINNWGGQERSTLEFISRCAQKNEVHLFAYSAVGLPPEVTFHRVPLLIRKPFFAKDFVFRIAVKLMMKGQHYDVINATGNCCFDSNVITIQFVQKRWALERGKMRSPISWKTPLKWFQSAYDVTWEKIIYGRLRDKWYVALSDSVAEDMKKFYRVKKIEVIPHGVDAAEFQPSPGIRAQARREMNVQDHETLLLFVGTFERKGLFFLLPAFARVAQKHNAKLCVVGDGPVARAKKAAEDLGVSDRVIFTGHTKEVPKYYQAADCSILPSLYDPFGLVGIEALAAGLPSAISAQSGSSSLITEGQNGFVIQNPDSIEELSEVLEKLVGNRQALKVMQEKARQSVMNNSWDRVWTKYEEVFAEASAELRR